MHKSHTMVVLLKTASVRITFIQIMQIRVQNKAKVFGKVDTMETYQVRPLSWRTQVGCTHLVALQTTP